MYTLQKLIEKGYVEKIETESTHIGAGYKIYIKLRSYSIGHVIIDVGIDEELTDAITLINKMIEVDEELMNRSRHQPEATKSRPGTAEDLKKLFENEKEIKAKLNPEDYAE